MIVKITVKMTDGSKLTIRDQEGLEAFLEATGLVTYEQAEEVVEEEPEPEIVCSHPTTYASGQCTKCGEFDVANMNFYATSSEEPMPDPDTVEIPADASTLTADYPIELPAQHQPVANFLKSDPDNQWYTRSAIAAALGWRLSSVSNSLAYLKRRGVVQNGRIGQYLNTHDWTLTDEARNRPLVTV